MAQTASSQPNTAESRPKLSVRGKAFRLDGPRAETLSLLLTGGVLLLGWLVLWNRLRGAWATNEQYEYGWFVPPLALVLLALRWADRPPPRRQDRFPLAATLLVAIVAALLLPIRLIEIPNPDWRLMLWIHCGALICLSLALLAWLGGTPWVRHFAFPFAFLLLAVPWPSGPEVWVVQSLMRGVATVSAEIMNVLGIPATAQGNLIHVRDQTVGVSEACSGIRSLQATLMGGLLFGELSRHTRQRRVALLGAGIMLAMVANVFRSSLLVWFAARSGTEGLEKMHDTVGFSVLIVVFVGLYLFNRWLGPPSPFRTEVSARLVEPLKPQPLAPALIVGAAVWLVAVEVACAAWYDLYTLPDLRIPRWTVEAPTGAPGYQELKVDRQTIRILQYDRGISSQWASPALPGSICSMYFFRWEPGHASTTQAEMHQPHICLTASGLTQTADWGDQLYTLPGGLELPMRRYEFTLRGRAVHVFFVAWQDTSGAQTLARGAGGRWDRLRAVARHQANLGRQTLELVVVGPQTAGEASAWFEKEIVALVRPLDTALMRAD